ncbi:hypothetical protein Dimus_022313 [Dionaea muscipula]
MESLLEGLRLSIADGFDVAAKVIDGPNEGARHDSPAAAAKVSDPRHDGECIAEVFTAHVCTSSSALLMEGMKGGVSPLGCVAGGHVAVGVRAGIIPRGSSSPAAGVELRRMLRMAGGPGSCGQAIAAGGEDYPSLLR